MSPEPAAPRKQNWARFSCGARDEPGGRGVTAPKASPEPGEAGELDPASSTPWPGLEPPGEEPPEQAEEAEAANGSVELGGPSRSPGHGAYLQSLERSSRHWVLSSAKAPGLDEAGGGGAEAEAGGAGSEGEIWYNPIPEDEDPPKASGEDVPWGGRGAAESPGARGAEEPAAGRTQACGEGLGKGRGGTGGAPGSPQPLSPCRRASPGPRSLHLRRLTVFLSFFGASEAPWTPRSSEAVVPCPQGLPDPVVPVPSLSPRPTSPRVHNPGPFLPTPPG